MKSTALSAVSAASIALTMIDSKITGNNNPDIDPVADDKDGIRLDEGGEGDVTATIINSQLDGNAAEGIEIDELGEGDVVVSVQGSTFDNNGDQPQLPSDLEDGLDVDEAGRGDIWVNIMDTSISGNQDEGLDLDEEDEGNVYLNVVDSDVSGNLDENVKVTQLQNAELTQGGSITARFSASTVNESLDGDGIKLESFDNGDDEELLGTVFASVQNSEVTGNASDDIQLEAESGELVLRNTSYGELDLTTGITLTELP